MKTPLTATNTSAKAVLDAALDTQQCEQARLSRDRRFDGLFYVAVRSTGIYCRPVCPAPAAKAQNVRYFGTAATATAAGYRPCLRCRPELAPGADLHQRAQGQLRQALQRIEEGALDRSKGAELAAELGVSERHLRRLFQQQLGVSPQQVALSRRLLFAKQLLHDTHLRITEVALAAGFASLRRFNDAFQKAYGMNPRSLRKAARQAVSRVNGAAALVLRLPYRPPYDFLTMLHFLRERVIAGLEWADETCYQRVLPGIDPVAWVEVRDCPQQYYLEARLWNVAAEQVLHVARGLRRLFDVDADSRMIDQQLALSPLLAPWVAAYPGVRVPGTLDGFELALRAIIGQQVSVAAARTLLGRVLTRAGGVLAQAVSPQLYCRFPTPAAVLAANLNDCGLTGARIRTIQTVAAALLEGRVSLRAGQGLASFISSWCALPGVGPWTAHYLAMRTLHHPDAFPAGDLILRRAASYAFVHADLADVCDFSERQLEQYSQSWRPWRAYAALLLWQAFPSLKLKNDNPRPTNTGVKPKPG